MPARHDPHAKEILRGAGNALVIKLAAAGLSFLFNLLLSRLLGAEGSGLFFLALAPASVAAVLCRAGFDNALLRHVSLALAEGRQALARAYVHHALFATGLLSLLVSLALAGASPWLAEHWFHTPSLTPALALMACTVLPLALSQLLGQVLRAQRRITASQLVLNLIVPAVALASLTPWVAYLQLNGAVMAQLVACVLAALLGLLLWWKAAPASDGKAEGPVLGTLWDSARPLYVAAALQLFSAWTATFLLGALSNPTEVGLYNVAQRAAVLISFVLIAVNSISAPKFASLSAASERDALARAARTANRLAAAAAAPVALLMLIGPAWVMGLFGESFRGGGATLMVLAAGQYFSVATGSVGNLLMMCGQEQAWRNIMVVVVMLNLGLCALLIPAFGALGAAYATTAALVTQNLLAAFVVWRRLGFLSVPFLPMHPGQRSC